MISTAVSSRSSRGFNVISMRPLLSVDVDAVDADERGEAGDVAIFEDRIRQRLLSPRHLGEGDVLARGGDALDRARVLQREKALRDLDILQAGRRQRQKRDDQGQSLVIEHPPEPAVVFVDDGLKAALGGPPDPACGFVRIGRMISAHIIGTSVSETTAESTIVIASVIANSWNSRPTTSCMNRSGIRTAISETVSEMMVKPISPAPCSAACERLIAALDVAGDVLDHHDRVVDDEAARDRQRHQRQIVEREAEQVHSGERADERQRHRETRNQRRRQVAQKDEDHQHDQPDREPELELDVA